MHYPIKLLYIMNHILKLAVDNSFSSEGPMALTSMYDKRAVIISLYVLDIAKASMGLDLCHTPGQIS